MDLQHSHATAWTSFARDVDLNLFQVPFLCMCFQKTFKDDLVKFSPMQYLQHEGNYKYLQLQSIEDEEGFDTGYNLW